MKNRENFKIKNIERSYLCSFPETNILVWTSLEDFTIRVEYRLKEKTDWMCILKLVRNTKKVFNQINKKKIQKFLGVFD